jgi:hypothetical protein
MEKHTWRVWKNNRIADYVSAYSEWDAVRFARAKHGPEVWVEKLYYGQLKDEWQSPVEQRDEETSSL